MAEVEIVDPPAPSKIVHGRDELNLAEFPLSAISTRTSSAQQTMLFEDMIWDKSRKEMVNRKLTITGSSEYGLPTALDDEVILGLVQLSKLQGFAARKVHFSRYQLIRVLGWRDESRSYSRIEEALNRWISVTLVYNKAWWNKEEESWVNEKFHILERVSVLDRDRRKSGRPRQGDFPFSFFVWNDVIFQSFRSGNLKSLDFEFYKALEGAISKRLYRFLDKRFYLRRRLEFDLRELAWEHIGLSRNYDAANLKRKLAPAICELEERGFLVPKDKKERFLKISSGLWRVVFERANQTDARDLQAEPESRADLVEGLKERGVSELAAKDLVAEVPPQRIEDQIEVFDWLRSKQDKRISKSPPGYLVASIKKSFAMPEGYQTKEQRKNREEAEATKLKMDKANRQRVGVKKAVEEEKQRQQRKLIEKYWNSLSKEEQHCLESEALRNADKFTQEKINEGGALTDILLKSKIDLLIRSALEKEGAIK